MSPDTKFGIFIVIWILVELFILAVFGNKFIWTIHFVFTGLIALKLAHRGTYD